MLKAIITNRRQENTVFDEVAPSGTIVDDEDISHTRHYSWAVKVLRLLNNVLTRTVESWECFKCGDIRCFDVDSDARHQSTWPLYMSDIRRDLDELQALRTSLRQKIEMFDNMKSGVSQCLP